MSEKFEFQSFIKHLNIYVTLRYTFFLHKCLLNQTCEKSLDKFLN